MERQKMARAEVYDIPSGMGGAFTVTNLKLNADGSFLVRIVSGRFEDRIWRSCSDFDGKRWTATSREYENKRNVRSEFIPSKYLDGGL